jgi:nitroreductase
MNAQEISDVLKSRRSVRKFTNDTVPRSAIEKMIEAASWAPSGSNRQNWQFIVIESTGIKEQLHAALVQRINEYAGRITDENERREFINYSKYYTFFHEAPVVVAVVKLPYDSLNQRIMRKNGLVNGATSTADVQGPSAAIENLLLMAHALGYGTCWMTGPLIARDKLEPLLGILHPDELLALIPVGVAAVTMKNAPKRKPVAEIVSYI